MEANEAADLTVYTGHDSVPQTFQDAYATVGSGGLRVWRWSTRHEAKRFPVAEFPPGNWTGYRHLGPQGDEPAERPVQENRTPPATGSALTPGIEEMLAREDEVAGREPGAPENLRPARERPALPPRDLPVPTHRLPQRAGDGETELIPVVPAPEGWRPAGLSERVSRRRPRRGQFPGGFVGMFAVFVSALVSVR